MGEDAGPDIGAFAGKIKAGRAKTARAPVAGQPPSMRLTIRAA
jgi:hypothetical protein